MGFTWISQEIWFKLLKASWCWQCPFFGLWRAWFWGAQRSEPVATPPLTKCMTCESHLGATPVASKCARTEEIGERGDFLRPSLNSQEASWIHTLPVTHRMIFSLDITTFFFESLHLSIHFRYLQIVHACPCPSEWNTHWTVKLLFAFAAQLHDVILFRQMGPSVCWDGRRTSEKKRQLSDVTRQVSTFVWGLVRALSWWP